MKRSRWMTICAALIAAANASAQVPSDIDLFSDDLPAPPVRARIVNGVRVQQAQPPAPAPPALPAEFRQVLVFHNGRQLRGELVEMTKDEIVWRRKDAGEPLRFARAEVRRIALGTPKA